MDYINDIKWHPDFPDYGAGASGTIWNKKVSSHNKTGEVKKQKLYGSGDFGLNNKNGKWTVKPAMRFTWECFYGIVNRNELIVSINNRKDDYRLCNLNKISISEMLGGRRKFKNSTSKYKGVSFYKNTNTWVAKMAVNKAIVHLGTFKTEEEAARVFDENTLWKNNQDLGLLQ